VVSDSPFGVKPDRQNFPMRNGIITAGHGVVVVRSEFKSGGSSRQAGEEQGGSLFAVRGAPIRLLSRGANS